jgi:hypothetical protein
VVPAGVEPVSLAEEPLPLKGVPNWPRTTFHYALPQLRLQSLERRNAVRTVVDARNV